jgi:amino acid permease
VLAYLNLSSTGATVFVDLIDTDAFQGWVLIRVVNSGSRKATFAQNIVDLPLPFALPALRVHVVYVGPFVFLCLLVQGFSVFIFGMWNTSTFLTSYICTLVFLGFYFGRKAVFRRDDPCDCVRTDRPTQWLGLGEVIAREEPEKPSGPWMKRIRALWGWWLRRKG